MRHRPDELDMSALQLHEHACCDHSLVYQVLVAPAEYAVCVRVLATSRTIHKYEILACLERPMMCAGVGPGQVGWAMGPQHPTHLKN